MLAEVVLPSSTTNGPPTSLRFSKLQHHSRSWSSSSARWFRQPLAFFIPLIEIIRCTHPHYFLQNHHLQNHHRHHDHRIEKLRPRAIQEDYRIQPKRYYKGMGGERLL
ncbi:hypothetical protein AAC387_Pa03g2766 [Persea americana]